MLPTRSKLAVAAAALAVTSCASERTQLHSPTAPVSSLVPPPAPPVKLSLVVEATREASAAPAVGVTALVADRFVAVPLPPDTSTVVSVVGRTDRDVWLLTSSGSVLHWDGEGAVSQGSPRCWADTCCGRLVDCDAMPGACTEAASEGCPSQTAPVCAKPVQFSQLQIRGTPAELFARAFVDTGGLRPSVVDARWFGGKRWSCEQSNDDLIRPDADARGDEGQTGEIVLDGSSLRFEGPAHLLNALGGHSLTIDGRRVPVPDYAGYGMTGRYGLFAAARDDLWLWSYYSPIPRPGNETLLFHGNGLTWQPVSTGLETIVEVWGDGSRRVWVLGQNQAAAYLLRREPEREGWVRFTMPSDWVKDGQLTAAVGRGPDDFWVLGVSAFVHGTGAELSRIEAPLDLGGFWRSPSGELWVVGARRGAKPDAEDRVKQGAAFRWVVPPGEGAP